MRRLLGRVINVKKHKKLLIFTFIAILAACLFTVCNFYYTKDRQINRMITSLKDPNSQVAQYVVASTPDMRVTDASLKPLQDYFKNHQSAAKSLEYNLKQGIDNGEIQLVQAGKYFLFFDKYKLRIQCYRPQVQTNHSNSTLYVNNENYGKMTGGNQNYYQDLGLVFPGRYHILVKSQVNNRKLDADSIVNIWSNKTINMKIKTATFQIRSVPNGEVYINDHKVATLNKKGQYTFKNYPLAKRMEIYIKSKFAGQTIKSKNVTDLSQSISTEFSNSEDDITDYGGAADYQGNNEKDVYQDAEGDYIVNPIWPGLIKVEDAAKMLYTNFKQPVALDFENGQENSDYQKIEKQHKKWKKDKKLKDIDLEVKVLSVLPGKANFSRINYELTVIKKYKGKSKQKTKFLYQDAILHQIDGQQKIQTLGKYKKID